MRRTDADGEDDGATVGKEWHHLLEGDDAGLDFGLDFHDAVAARIANEVPDDPTCLSFHPLLVMTGGGDQSSWLSVVAGAGRVHTTTSRRVPQWARAKVRQRAGEGSADARAIPR